MRAGLFAKARDVTTYAPNHTQGNIADVTLDKDNGALLVHQADLEFSKDEIGAVPAQSDTLVANTPIASDTASAQAAAANAARKGLVLGNSDANQCLVKFGGTASATDFHVVVPALGSLVLASGTPTHAIHAIWPTAGTGYLAVLEMT